MDKFAEDERIEQMKAQKRRMKMMEHKREVDRLLDVRAREGDGAGGAAQGRAPRVGAQVSHRRGEEEDLGGGGGQAGPGLHASRCALVQGGPRDVQGHGRQVDILDTRRRPCAPAAEAATASGGAFGGVGRQGRGKPVPQPLLHHAAPVLSKRTEWVCTMSILETVVYGCCALVRAARGVHVLT